jgi:membrane-associated phospholipid phosphatase
VKDAKALRLCVLTVAITYVFAIPLYLFFPVYDPWVISQDPANTWYSGPVIDFRMPEIWPGVAESYWKFTTTNNEIPSLHSGLSAGLAAVAWASGHKRYAVLATVFATGIPIASLYIGVHWLVDILAGWLFAGIAFTVAWRVRDTVSLERLRFFRLPKDGDSAKAELRP